MDLADALRVIQSRHDLVDLDFALGLLGYRLLPAGPLNKPEPEEADLSENDEDEYAMEADGEEEEEEEEEDEEEEGANQFQDELRHPWNDYWPSERGRDDGGSEGPRWLWNFSGSTGGIRSTSPGSRLIPYILESDEFLSAEAEVRRTPIIARPGSTQQQEQLWAARVTQYANTWDRDRIRDVLRRRIPGKLVDVDQVVLLLAEGRPLKRIPTLSRFKVSPVVHVVYDVGLFAGPFGFDLRALLEVIRHAGRGDEDHQAFRYRIAHGCGQGPMWRWQQFHIPAHGASVVLISGGYGDDVQGRATEFHRIMDLLHRHGHQAHVIWFGDVPQTSRPALHHWTIRS